MKGGRSAKEKEDKLRKEIKEKKKKSCQKGCKEE